MERIPRQGPALSLTEEREQLMLEAIKQASVGGDVAFTVGKQVDAEAYQIAIAKGWIDPGRKLQAEAVVWVAAKDAEVDAEVKDIKP